MSGITWLESNGTLKIERFATLLLLGDMNDVPQLLFCRIHMTLGKSEGRWGDYAKCIDIPQPENRPLVEK